MCCSDQLLAERMLTAADGQTSTVDWAAQFPIGSIIHGRVDEVKPYGAVCDVEPNADVAGLVPNEQVSMFFLACQGDCVVVMVCVCDSSLGMPIWANMGLMGHCGYIGKRTRIFVYAIVCIFVVANAAVCCCC